ncbi:hypothetical protein ACJVC5_17630 [Peredibacter sp. HCB2-198]|uniref:hypothetical protein n=1 Tax=Peredibacter sp. HCB2-198 TaxID=3383025 RepID=UPI0038B610C8
MTVLEVKNLDTDNVCNTCKSKFETLFGKKINKPSKDKLQKDFFESVTDEYKKNIISNIIFTLKMRALPNNGNQFPKAAAACKMAKEDDFLKGCKSESAKRLLKEKGVFKSLQTSISNELAKILSTNEQFNPKDTLLTRTQSSCFIPEKDILFLSSSTIEEAFSPELINFISQLDTTKFKNMNELFSSPDLKSRYNGDIEELSSALKNHPYLSQYLSSPSVFTKFFKSIEKPSDVTQLRKSLYSASQDKSLDSVLAAKCSDSLRAYTESICSDKFESGSISTDPFSNFDKLSISKSQPDETEFANSEELIQKNLDFLSLCEVKAESNNINLSETNESISRNLEGNQRNLNLSDFKVEKFDSELGRLNQYLCDEKNSSCDMKKINCQILQKYKKLQDKNSLESKLANSSNKEVNNLLRSMIGDPKNLDPKTKEILVLQGILPKDDGTLVAQAEIPERQPGYFNQAPASASAQAKVTTPVQATSPVRAASTTRSQQSATNDSSNWTGQPTTSSTIPDLSDYYKNQKEMEEIESEIMRRLSAMPEKKPATKEAAKKIARDAYQKTGRSMPSTLEDYYANRMMAQNSPSTSSGFDEYGEPTGSAPSARREASVSNTESAAEKWKKDGMNRALADMHGARQGASGGAGREPASVQDDANAKSLATVALSVPEDPRISLSQSLSEKINKNDPETQLLQVLVKNKSNFILQMKSVNFKVIFDDQKKLRLLVESGDKKEAERLRPQLEIFFRRLSAL